MGRHTRILLLLTAGVLGVLGVAGLVSAQQGDAIGKSIPSGAPARIAPPPATAEAPPPPDATLKGAVVPAPPADEANVQPVEADSSTTTASSKPEAPKPSEPMKRPRFAVAILQAMDKV